MSLSLLDLVIPATCVGCGDDGSVMCRQCVVGLRQVRCHSPQPRPPDLPPVWASADYCGPVRAAILAYKEHGLRQLQRPLADGLSRAVAALMSLQSGHRLTSVPSRSSFPASSSPLSLAKFRGEALLVPIPAGALARWSRGGNHVTRLARQVARQLPGLAVTPALSVVKRRRDSVGLSAAQRADNLSGAFHVRPRFSQLLTATPIVLVDDLVTTGATLAEASRVIHAGGGHVLGCAVVAATARSHNKVNSRDGQCCGKVRATPGVLH